VSEADRLFCAAYETEFETITAASADQFKRLDTRIRLFGRAAAVLRNDDPLQQCYACGWVIDPQRGTRYGHKPGCPGEMR
jgi:hypothetical protein